MKGKQALFDIGIVLALPLLLIAGYYFWSSGGESPLLSLVVPQEATQEYGAQARAALATLKSIRMDGSLFDDPVYKSLHEFHVDIPMTTSFGRAYPFTIPDAVRAARAVKPH